MMKRYLIIIALLFAGKATFAQAPKDYSIQLMAAVQESPAQIVLSWDSIAYATSYQIFKKPKGSSSWGPAMAFLGATDTMYADNNVIVDSSYEYKMVALGVQTAYGYIHAGVKAPAIHNRGAMVVMIDDYFSTICATELDQLIRDLAGDGWEIIRHDVSRTLPDVAIKGVIQGDYTANPNVSAVLLVGHIAVPYSGFIYPDGHPDHQGAWSADVFYADMDGTWTDNVVNDNGATRPENWNMIGDGKWDQNFLPSSTELQVSRIDFFNMPAFNKTEEEMMITYLNRSHRFKMDSLTIARRALIDENFGNSAEAFSANGWRNFPGFVGRERIYEIEFVPSLSDSSFIWAYASGGGSYTSASGVGTTGSFVNNPVNGIFTMLFGSYFGDWDSQDNFLRAPLCSNVPALTSCWAGRPNWHLHHMSLGENIGYSAKASQNNNTLYTPTNSGIRSIHIALMGDLSLRMDYIKPPSGLSGGQLTDSSIFLNWAQSPDTGISGYYVYRADALYGNYQLVSPLLTNHNFEDHGLATGTYYYQVRAMKPKMTPSGGYVNLSIGTLSTGIFLDNTLTVTYLTAKPTINIYPNPAKEKITVTIGHSKAQKATFSIIDITGKKIQTLERQLTTGNNNISFDVQHLPAGVYALLVQTENGTISSQWVKAN